MLPNVVRKYVTSDTSSETIKSFQKLPNQTYSANWFSSIQWIVLKFDKTYLWVYIYQQVTTVELFSDNP